MEVQDAFLTATSNNSNTHPSHLQSAVATAVERYFASLNGATPENLHQIVIDEIEGPLLESALKYTGGNQVKTAKLLGIARGTLRKKLKHHGLSSKVVFQTADDRDI